MKTYTSLNRVNNVTTGGIQINNFVVLFPRNKHLPKANGSAIKQYTIKLTKKTYENTELRIKT